MKSITSDSFKVHFNESCYSELNNHIKSVNYSKIFIICDTNSNEYCVPYFLSNISTNLEIEIIEIEPGEENKNIQTCLGVWESLSELDADRKSLIINLGGGVVTDLGGFVACTFKRGVSYINVPTTLLSMVDASVGGKTGIDLGSLKNLVGVISNGEMVLIDTVFLNTLPAEQIKSGYSEVLKHGLIKNLNYWKKTSNFKNLNFDDLDEIIHESVVIKNEVVLKDPFENDLRKILNFGHTLGHAIESYFLTNETKKTLLHGEAIAIGMILETYISKELNDISEKDLEEIKNVFNSLFDKVEFSQNEIDEIIELLRFDKKNSHGQVKFVLLESIAKPKIDCVVSEKLINAAFQYYLK